MAEFDLDADTQIFLLQRQLRNGNFQPGRWRTRVIRDPKVRLIAAPPIRDRIVHRALIDDIGPSFERGYIEDSYTGSTGRGPHRAVIRYLGWQRGFHYRLHLDISRYFFSVHLPTLCSLLFRRINDPRTRELITRFLESGRQVYSGTLAKRVLGLDEQPEDPQRGLPLGSYLSQWSGTFYLNGLDHYIKRDLRVPAYLRYMDDFVLFANDREELIDARAAIEQWLESNRRLTLNPKHRDVASTRAPGIFLGYRISQAGIAPSRKLRRRLRVKVQQAAAKGSPSLVRTLRSYRGLLLF